MYRLRPTISRSRTLWTCSTLSSTSPESLISSINSTLPTSSSSSSSPELTLYAVTKHFPQDLLPLLQKSLPSKLNLGCLTEPLQPQDDHRIFTLSLAHYTPSSKDERIVTFSTRLSGRPNVSLGREHKPRAGGRPTKHELEFENRQFEKFLKGDKNWAFGDQLQLQQQGQDEVVDDQDNLLPNELKRLKVKDRKKVKELICFTADRIQPFLSSLSCSFPNSSTIGITSSSTPFHSSLNYPFTLFYNDQIEKSGAVGVAVINSSSSSSSSSSVVEIDYGNLTRFGPITTVTNSRGNILLTLSSQNAAQLLLSSVQKLPRSNEFTRENAGDSTSPFEFEASLSNPNQQTTKHISKDKDFYAALFNENDIITTEEEGQEVDLGKAKLVCRIMAGDPKRGAISFETEEEVEIGDKVIFLHRPDTDDSSNEDLTTTTTTTTVKKIRRPSNDDPSIFTFKTLSPSYVSPIQQTSTLSSTSSSSTLTSKNNNDQEEEKVVEKFNGFFANTENGIIVSRESRTMTSSGGGREVRLAGIEGTTVRLFSNER